MKNTVISLLILMSLTILTQSASAFYNPEQGRWLNRDPIEEKGGENVYRMVRNNPIIFIDDLGLIDITKIPGIMTANKWNNGATLMNYWFTTPKVNDTTTITMAWALTFARAKAVYDAMLEEKVYLNAAAKKEIIALAKKKKVYTTGGKFGSVKGKIETLDKDYIQYRVVGSLTDPVDDMYAALGKFTFRVLIEGDINIITSAGKSYHCFKIKKVGIYIRDSYDFKGSQSLGYWNAKTNYGGKNPLKGDEVTNADFRNYTAKFKKGADFLVFSDVDVTTLKPAANFVEEAIKSRDTKY